ncbi:ATP-binding protein [Paenibacillus sp. sgz5001063]|uniref:ATP-binding protein n=1 Tax=Paenibacillus sp. sgz5001063 TaxID=3242474 RepID=UPI0036D33B30
MLITFLILFIVTLYGLLHYLLINQQKQQLESWLNDRVNSMHEYGVHGLNRNGNSPEDWLRKNPNESGEITGILADLEGKLITANLPYSRSFSELSGDLEGLIPDSKETIYRTIRYSEADTANHQGSGELLVAGKTIFHEGKAAGILYAVKDTSAQLRLFQWLIVILFAVAILFFGLAIFLSYSMSKKAMIPVRRSFARQQEFVGDASHELRTPLSVMLSSIDALEMEGVGDDQPFARKVLENMRDEAKRMIRLSDGLLTLARSDSDAAVVQKSSYNVTECAGQIVRSLEALASERRIMLHFSAGEEIMINADKERLSQLFVILLDNAIKYTPEGGKVELRLFRTEGRAHMLGIEVKDNGIGIDARDLSRLFERFYRVDKSRTRELGGYGIGLSIAKWIVEAHAGSIHVDSIPGEGSTFTVLLPL